MWISRKAWQDVQDRLKAVEKRHRELSELLHDATEIVVYDRHNTPSLLYGTNTPNHAARITSVVEKIMRHIGMELVYVKGEPTRAELKNIEKKS